MIPERTGLIVWVQHLKSVKRLERLGTIHYVSRRMKYVVLYTNKDQESKVIAQMQKWNFVKKIEKSYRSEIKTEYDSNVKSDAATSV